MMIHPHYHVSGTGTLKYADASFPGASSWMAPSPCLLFRSRRELCPHFVSRSRGGQPYFISQLLEGANIKSFSAAPARCQAHSYSSALNGAKPTPPFQLQKGTKPTPPFQLQRGQSRTFLPSTSRGPCPCLLSSVKRELAPRLVSRFIEDNPTSSPHFLEGVKPTLSLQLERGPSPSSLSRSRSAPRRRPLSGSRRELSLPLVPTL